VEAAGKSLDLMEAGLIFLKKGIEVVPLKPQIARTVSTGLMISLINMKEIHLKKISISCGSRRQKGEVVITRFGLECNAIYAVKIREELTNKQEATVFLDLKPTLSYNDLVEKIQNRASKDEKDYKRA
jgi:predicted flavoprotein YhiN